MKNPKRGQKMVRPEKNAKLKYKVKPEHEILSVDYSNKSACDTVQNDVPQESNYNKSEKNCRQKPK